MPATLRFTTGSWSGRDIPLPEPEARIGRDPGVEVVIPPDDQRFVSRVHATIVREGAHYVVRDLESSNGTWVNGERVRQSALGDGDEIQFGRHGPVARFHAPQVSERDSQMVRRVVHEAMTTKTRQSRRRLAAVALLIVVGGAAVTWGALRSRVFEPPQQTFRRLADTLEARVVLVEVGVVYQGDYMVLGHGSGFFAGNDGLVLTNKHVVHDHLYDSKIACVAASFTRHGLSFEDALVITIWPGGTRFRQSTAASGGDRALGYSTEQQTLSLVATAPDTLMPPQEISCRDAFDGEDFAYAWRRHGWDNNDLAVLRATATIPAIPLADSEPRAEDEVMVLGFPTGTVPLETTTAEPIRRVGRVLRTRDTIQIDAVVLGGNSGGPLIGVDGRVLGVTTRGTAESLNMAIKIEHAKRLLERARRAR